MRSKPNTMLTLVVLISLLIPPNGIVVSLLQASLVGDVTITFEETIPAPSNIQTQYCIDPSTNKGVKFESGFEITQPLVATSSGSHALTELIDGEIDFYFGPLTISFTAGQSHVGAMVGLDQHYDFPVTAILRAYDDPDPGEGTKLTPDSGPTVTLGNGPTPITTSLSFSTPGGEPLIRRVEIEFQAAFGLKEVIDDLTFSDIGPLCVIDVNAPTVQILEPVFGQTINNPQALLHFHAQDVGSGIANIKVIMLGPGNTELGSYFSCGGGGFAQNCPGFPLSLDIESQYNTFLPVGTTGIRVEAMDFAGNVGKDEVTFNLKLPDPTFNLWALGMEVTQGIQSVVPSSTISRGGFAPVVGLFTGPPLVAGKRTVVRVYPAVEDTIVPVVGARVSLLCIKTLEANPLQSQPCDGPETADLVNPEVTVDPANGNDITTLRLNPSLTWNFILPPEWTVPGGPRWLVALVQAPINVPECGSVTSGCHDGANLFVVQLPEFHETAPLIIKPRFACVRRSASQAREDCLTDLVSGTLAATADDATTFVESFLWQKDWDSDGLLDPYFNVTYPVADGTNGIEILPPIMGDFVDGDFSTPDGELKLSAYLNQMCDAYILDFWEIFTDPGELWAIATPPNFSYLGFVPPPADNNGISLGGKPCAIVNLDLNSSNIIDNDFSPTTRFTTHRKERTIAHEIGHTFGFEHAGCSHDFNGNGIPDEEEGGGCDPAPSVFPCPHGGICLSVTEQDEPFGFNTYNMGVLPPRSGGSHAHDFMSYGGLPAGAPDWISRHTYDRLFIKLRDALASSASELTTQAEKSQERQASSPQPALFISGRFVQPDNQVTINSLYQLPVNRRPKTGKGSYILELQRADGQVLTRRRFEPLSLEDGNSETPSHFFELLAYSPKAARLVLKKGKTVLFERTRTPNAPIVNILSPAAGEVWNTGIQTISWDTSDLDGDSLVYTVQYSRDLGATWTTLTLNWTETSWQADAALLAGSEPEHALIRLLASDGFNTTIVESAPFTVNDKAPHIKITLPANGAVFQERELVDLIGAALDVEEGSLEDAAYRWSSDLDGNLGQGHELRTESLSVGLHVITLTVQDTAGNTSQDSIAIEILAQPNTQPIADAGPGQTVAVGALVMLDGDASFDPDGDTLSFAWHFVSVPDDLTGQPEIVDPQSANPSFLAPVAGEYVLELVVRDEEVNSFPSQVTITVVDQTTIQIDVKPGKFPNRIELEKNVCRDDDELQVAILTTPDFDALQTDASTLRIGDPKLSGTASPLRSRARDVDLDGDSDLLLAFSLCDFITNEALNIDSTELVLTGNTLESAAITGKDSVEVMNNE